MPRHRRLRYYKRWFIIITYYIIFGAPSYIDKWVATPKTNNIQQQYSLYMLIFNFRTFLPPLMSKSTPTCPSRSRRQSAWPWSAPRRRRSACPAGGSYSIVLQETINIDGRGRGRLVITFFIFSYISLYACFLMI